MLPHFTMALENRTVCACVESVFVFIYICTSFSMILDSISNLYQSQIFLSADAIKTG